MYRANGFLESHDAWPQDKSLLVTDSLYLRNDFCTERLELSFQIKQAGHSSSWLPTYESQPPYDARAVVTLPSIPGSLA